MEAPIDGLLCKSILFVQYTQFRGTRKMKRMHYLKKGLNISLLIAFTGIYKRAKLQTIMFWQHRFTRLQFWATGFCTVCIYFKRYL